MSCFPYFGGNIQGVSRRLMRAILRGGEMIADYDLSNLPNEQAETWICLRADEICGQIIAEQAERLGFPVASVRPLLTASG